MSRPISADYTVYDNLFHKLPTSHLRRAVPGLAEKIREDQGVVVATLFAFGAMTPLRDLIIAGKRKDPDDTGEYEWAEEGRGLRARFWDNRRFSDWIKRLWETGQTPDGFTLAKEGRFLGIEVDAMDTPRQSEPFFAQADRIRDAVRRFDAGGAGLASCKALFQLGVQ